MYVLQQQCQHLPHHHHPWQQQLWDPHACPHEEHLQQQTILVFSWMNQHWGRQTYFGHFAVSEIWLLWGGVSQRCIVDGTGYEFLRHAQPSYLETNMPTYLLVLNRRTIKCKGDQTVFVQSKKLGNIYRGRHKSEPSTLLMKLLR